MVDYYIDNIVKSEFDKIKKLVTKKDRDWVCVIDGEEGSGKSVLAQQFAKYLDANFNVDNICFNSDQFMDRIKKAPKYSCIVMDEAFSSANSRASLTEVNRAMVGLATEMRQRNLFVIIVLPSFFDLDKYFALWRCRCLFHVYFKMNGERGQYVLFPKTAKKLLYLNGKRTYNYSKPKSPYAPCTFRNHYTVDEHDYRTKKATAFKKRATSNQAKKWKAQRDGLINEMYHNLNVKTSDIVKSLLKWGKKPLSMRELQKIVQIYDVDGTAPSDTDDGEANKRINNKIPTEKIELKGV